MPETLRVTTLLLFAALTLGGCAGAWPGNPQNHAGITEADVEFCDRADGTVYICAAHIIDGKEKQNVSLGVQTPSGLRFTYTATNVAAFTGQATRAEVEKAVAAAVRDTLPGIVEQAVKAAVGGVVP